MLGTSSAMLKGADLALGVIMACVLFAVVFGSVPAERLPWSHIWLGAAVTAMLITVGRYAIATYLSHADIGSAYGAAGSLVALMAWVYYSAQVFLLGAHATWVFSRARTRQTT